MEAILGPEDHELAVCLTLLASLYNYDLNEYDQAERFYLRALEISM